MLDSNRPGDIRYCAHPKGTIELTLVERIEMTNEEMCNLKRIDILALAIRLAADGAHYLWSAEGHKPTKAARNLAPAVLSKDQADKTCFCAATLTYGGVVYVCAGRCLHPDLAGIAPTPKVVNSPKDDGNLQRFIDKYGSNLDAEYGWGFELTPRVVKGDSIMDYTRNVDLTGQVVWGEGCDDTLHFDCGGFVRYVVNQVCDVPIAGISANPTQPNSKGKPMGRVLTEGEMVMPADILDYGGHIGFATGVPQLAYSKNAYYGLAQAESATVGVTFGYVHKAANKQCIRLSDSTLLNMSI